jgi:nucleoside-diphosphate-sugar epimerase
MIRRLNVLMTGGAGFIGLYLCRELSNVGHQIRIVDVQDGSGVDSKYDFRQIDILDKEGLIDATKGIDIVIHLAAKHRFFGVSEKDFFLVNKKGTQNVIEAMDTQSIKKIIFFSTVAVYGDSGSAKGEETDCRPHSSYGRSKLAAEKCIERWASKHPENTAVIIRPTVVYGPHNKGNIYRLIRQIYYRGYIPVGEGNNIKSIAYIENLTGAVAFLLNQTMNGVNVFNYADAPHMSYRRIVDLIYSELGRKSLGLCLPVSPMLKMGRTLDRVLQRLGIEFPLETAIQKVNKQTHYRADKIRTLGYSSKFSSEEGLGKTVRWYTTERGKRSPEA